MNCRPTMLKEDEAKRLFCPFLSSGQPMMQRCLGAQCMAWREVEGTHALTRARGVVGYCGAMTMPPDIMLSIHGHAMESLAHAQGLIPNDA